MKVAMRIREANKKQKKAMQEALDKVGKKFSDTVEATMQKFKVQEKIENLGVNKVMSLPFPPTRTPPNTLDPKRGSGGRKGLEELFPNRPSQLQGLVPQGDATGRSHTGDVMNKDERFESIQEGDGTRFKSVMNANFEKKQRFQSVMTNENDRQAALSMANTSMGTASSRNSKFKSVMGGVDLQEIPDMSETSIQEQPSFRGEQSSLKGEYSSLGGTAENSVQLTEFSAQSTDFLTHPAASKRSFESLFEPYGESSRQEESSMVGKMLTPASELIPVSKPNSLLTPTPSNLTISASGPPMLPSDYDRVDTSQTIDYGNPQSPGANTQSVNTMHTGTTIQVGAMNSQEMTVTDTLYKTELVPEVTIKSPILNEDKIKSETSQRTRSDLTSQAFSVRSDSIDGFHSDPLLSDADSAAAGDFSKLSGFVLLSIVLGDWTSFVLSTWFEIA